MGRGKERDHAHDGGVPTPTTEEVNAKLRDGSIGQTMETMLGNLQPEAAYFCPRDGKRGGIASSIWRKNPASTKLEPLWLEIKRRSNRPCHERG